MTTVDWMADVLRDAGVTVIEYPGWRDRAASGSFTPRAVMWHHDASAAGPSPGVPRMIAEIGNASTPPPLSQAWVDTAGTWHLTAAGRANHAGLGTGWGRIRANRGNEDAIGVETDHTIGEPWPAALLSGLRRGTAALLKHLGADPADSLAGHKEYAPRRKPDPEGLDMSGERMLVAELMEDNMPTIDEFVEAMKFRVLCAGDFRPLEGGRNFGDAANETLLTGFRNGAALAALTAAVAEGDLDPDSVLARVDTAVREATEQAITATVLPALRATLVDVLGEDDTEQADAIVTALAERLRPAA